MKYIKKICFLLIITIILFSGSVFATSQNMSSSLDSMSSSSQTISLSSQTVSTNTEFYLILNLSNISFSKFKVEITNTSSLTVEEVTSSVSNLSTNSVVTSFIVDKSSINLDKLGVVYTSPTQSCKINFEVKITSLDEDVESLTTELNYLELEITNLENTLTSLKNSLSGIVDNESEEYKTLVEEIDNTSSTLESKTQEKTELEDKISNFIQETMEESVSVDVSETSETKDSREMEENDDKMAWGDKDNMMEEMEKEMSSSMRKMMEQMSGLESELENANNTISSLQQTVSYQGSQNNYLSSLSITGVEFKNEFKKTNTSYFATVGEDITDVTVNATAEDSDAIVTIYGNTDLKTGKNKILINVTSEDGSVRTYKIYVTK